MHLIMGCVRRPEQASLLMDCVADKQSNICNYRWLLASEGFWVCLVCLGHEYDVLAIFFLREFFLLYLTSFFFIFGCFSEKFFLHFFSSKNNVLKGVIRCPLRNFLFFLHFQLTKLVFFIRFITVSLYIFLLLIPPISGIRASVFDVNFFYIFHSIFYYILLNQGPNRPSNFCELHISATMRVIILKQKPKDAHKRCAQTKRCNS